MRKVLCVHRTVIQRHANAKFPAEDHHFYDGIVAHRKTFRIPRGTLLDLFKRHAIVFDLVVKILDPIVLDHARQKAAIVLGDLDLISLTFAYDLNGIRLRRKLFHNRPLPCNISCE